MANKYTNLIGTNKVKDEYKKINTGFDKVEADINDVNGRVDTVDARVNTIITTPIEGAAAAQEIVDARVSAVKGKTFATLDARFEETEQEIATLDARVQSVTLTTTSDADTLGEAGKIIMYKLTGDPVIWNTTTQGSLLCHRTTSGAYGYQIYMNQFYTYKRNLVNNVWSPWEKIVTDKQSDWINATLQNGWTGELKYRINQIGLLEIHGNIVAGTTSYWTTICEIAYRPWRNTAVIVMKGANTISDTIWVNTAKKIEIIKSGLIAGDNIQISLIITPLLQEG